ncbi:MAG: hypothetical protein ABI867_38230 [Kofleriaceae bacterium]
MFVWTAELEASCPPVRGQGAPVVPAPLADKKLASAAASVKATGYTPRASLVALFETGKGDRADEADALLLAATTKGGAAREALVHAGVDRWFDRHGAAGALEIFSLFGTWVPLEGVFDADMRAPAAARVRHHLAHAADYEAALAVAVGLGDRPQWVRARYNATREVLAYLFPDHRPLFDAAVDRLISESWTTTYLLGAVMSADDVTRIGAARVGYGDWDRHAVHVARVSREAGLVHLAEYTSRSTSLVGVMRALTAYVSPEAATSLAQYLECKDKAAPGILRAYFAAHPELAAAAVQPYVTSKKKKLRELATSLIA